MVVVWGAAVPAVGGLVSETERDSAETDDDVSETVVSEAVVSEISVSETLCTDSLSVIEASVSAVSEAVPVSVSGSFPETVSDGRSDSEAACSLVSETAVAEAVVPEADGTSAPLWQEESIAAQSRAYIKKIFFPL